MSTPAWLPAIITLNDHNGSWNDYIDAVYAVFRADFVASQPSLRGQRVGVRRHPSHDGKEFTFWHCVSEGKVEEHRTPDLRRCERIPWTRPIIDNHGDVDVWTVRKNRDERVHLWFGEEYLVVLGVRSTYYLLITAFPTNRQHTQNKLRKERDRANP